MDLLFDTPWWLPTILAGLGLALLAIGNNRQERKLLWVGGLLALVGVLIAVISYLVETDVEKVISRTRLLANAVDKRDWATFRSLLDPKTSFSYYPNREELVEGARKTADYIGLKSVRLTSVQARQTDTLITVDVDALSVQERTLDRPVLTSWRLYWQDFGNGWFLHRIEVLPNKTIGPEQVNRELVR